MPKLIGKERRVRRGENNPRHFIIIPVGTGNQYCCNCEYCDKERKLCAIFREPLAENSTRGFERCQKCRQAERLVQAKKDEARNEGMNAGLYKAQEGSSCGIKSSLEMQRYNRTLR